MMLRLQIRVLDLSWLMYIDIHTHNNIDGNVDVLSILNVFGFEAEVIKNLSNQWTSVGIHPWHLDRLDVQDQLKRIEVVLIEFPEKIWALGEVGLDKTIDVEMDTQLGVLVNQLDILVKVDTTKNVIIHCVQAYSIILEVIKKYPQLNFILHAFNGSKEILSQALKIDNIFFSFGKREFKSNKFLEYFDTIPLNRIFFETDSDTNFTIQEVYFSFSRLKGIQLSDLIKQIQLNINQLFILK